MLVSTVAASVTDQATIDRSPTPELKMSDHYLDSSSESSSSNSSQQRQHPLNAFGKLVGDGFASHVRRWKMDHTRRKLESHLVMRRRARLSVESRQGSMSRSHSLESLGDIGMTLFSPLDVPLESATDDNGSDGIVSMVISKEKDERDHPKSSAVQIDTDTSVTVEDDESDEEDFYNNDFICNDGTEIESPLILSVDDMKQLRQAMPSSTQLKLWKRLYSLARDGDVFQTFLNSVAGHRQTLLVIQTSTGETFGGFAEAHWGKLALKTDGSYHGTGRSFLFSIDSAFRNLQSSPSTVVLPDKDPNQVTIYPWQGVNEYSILCSTRDGGRLCMGGGGKDASFGFCVQDHFTKGTSGPCETFGNKESLSSAFHFDILDFEVYGFVHNW
jgi:hypothetical protein